MFSSISGGANSNRQVANIANDSLIVTKISELIMKINISFHNLSCDRGQH